MKELIQHQRDFFMSDKTKAVAFRKEMLTKLYDAIVTCEQPIYDALHADLGKSEAEAYLTEIQIVLGEITVLLKNLDRWQKPKRVRTSISCFPASSKIYREPFGVTLILSPWNYPVQLTLAPLAGAIAGGNCAILKTSKSSSAVSEVLKQIVSSIFPQNYVACVSDEFSYDEILNEKYDLIFFTGSERVGKTVMSAAAKHLTPVVLELGGKSPCIIEKTANITLAAKRIAWGKLLNAGQTCVAPDYVLVDSSVKDDFVEQLVKQIALLYGDPLANPNYPKIISEHHFNRLYELIANESQKFGGEASQELQKISPAIFLNASFNDEIMKEEIFGPILPIIAFNSFEDAIEKIADRPKPLACYLFTRDKKAIRYTMRSVSFGSGCVNDVVMQLANHHLPFGGVGGSGMGHYHGRYSFDTFTREKGVLMGKSYFDIPLRYPPYSKTKLKIIKKITK